VVPHALWPSLHRSTQFVRFLTAGYPTRSYHPLPTLILERELLFLTHSLRMPWGLRHLTTPWLCELWDVLGGRDRARLERHMEAEIERDWRCTWRPRSSEFGYAVAGHLRLRLEEYLETVHLEEVDLEAVDWEAVDQEWVATGSWDSIRWLTHNCGNVENWVQQGRPRDETWETCWELETVDVGMMQYSVYTALGVNSWSWHGEIQRGDLSSCS